MQAKTASTTNAHAALLMSASSMRSLSGVFLGGTIELRFMRNAPFLLLVPAQA
jgi:hypothetical protein